MNKEDNFAYNLTSKTESRMWRNSLKIKPYKYFLEPWSEFMGPTNMDEPLSEA